MEEKLEETQQNLDRDFYSIYFYVPAYCWICVYCNPVIYLDLGSSLLNFAPSFSFHTYTSLEAN